MDSGRNDWDCLVCRNSRFKHAEELAQHLRREHCTKEGGSFVCRYGENKVCSTLPVEGVNDADYEQHVYKHHVIISPSIFPTKSRSNSVYSDSLSHSNEWTMYSASQNLSAVLNDPGKPKQRDFFTKLWGEGFSEISKIPDPNHLPKITNADFEFYLKRFSKRHKRHRRYKVNTAIADQEVQLLQHFPLLRVPTDTERISFDLSQVPDIFLDSNFTLSNPNTFNEVFPHIMDCMLQDKSVALSDNAVNINGSSKLVLEKLSHYLDTVEVEIAKQVRAKSGAFFHTMTSHDTLMDQLGQTIEKVRNLRRKIENIDKTLVLDGLQVLKDVRTRNNYLLVLNKLRIMATVYQTQPTVKLLLSTTDYLAALELIYTTKDLLNNELAGVQCFRHLSSELNEMINMIDTLMMGEFERYVIADLGRPLTEDHLEVLQPDKLSCLITGMLRRRCLFFTECYKKEIVDVAKSRVKDMMKISADLSGNQLINIKEEYTKLFTMEEWVKLLEITVKSLSILLTRIKNTSEVMREIVEISCKKADGVIESFSAVDEEDYKVICKKLSQLMTTSCRYISDTICHLISHRSLISEMQEEIDMRSTSNNHLSEQATQEHLYRISDCVQCICKLTDEICPEENVSLSLKSALKTEIGKFTRKFHYERLTKIALILENESWKQAQVPWEFQQLVDQIYNTGKFTKCKPGVIKRPGNILIVGNEKFVVIGTVLLLINMIAEYCSKAEDIKLSASFLLRYVAELLQHFNSKSCKLVLGAEAVSDKTGLKRITSTNLALLIRALQLLLLVIPQIRAHFVALLPESKMTTLDKVSDELHAHIRDINFKLVYIASQIITTELQNWEAKAPVPSKAFQNLSKQLCKLHEAVKEVLTLDDMHNLYRKINITFKRIFKEHIRRMNIVNNGGPQHGLVTTELMFYLEDLKKADVLPKDELNLSEMDDIWT